MKKKIFSWLVSLSVAATMFAAFAIQASASNANPTITVTSVELTPGEYETNMEKPLGAGLKAYQMTIGLSGLALSNKATGSGGAARSQRDGTVLKTFQFDMIADDADKLVEVTPWGGEIGSGTYAAGVIRQVAVLTDVKSFIPTRTDGQTALASVDEIAYAGDFIVVVSGDVNFTYYSEVETCNVLGATGLVSGSNVMALAAATTFLYSDGVNEPVAANTGFMVAGPSGGEEPEEPIVTVEGFNGAVAGLASGSTLFFDISIDANNGTLENIVNIIFNGPNRKNPAVQMNRYAEITLIEGDSIDFEGIAEFQMGIDNAPNGDYSAQVTATNEAGNGVGNSNVVTVPNAG